MTITGEYPTVYVNMLIRDYCWSPPFLSFDFCKVDEDSPDQDPVESLGQVVLGERIRASPYNVTFRRDVIIPINLCNKIYSHAKDREKLQFLTEHIREEYMHQWVVDNMPVAWCYKIIDHDEPFCSTRFPVGCYIDDDGMMHDACYHSHKFADKGTTYLFNNVKLVLSYHKGSAPSFTDGRIVRAEVEVDSCQDSGCSMPMIIDSPALRKRLEAGTKVLQVPYMYTVEFVEAEEIKWASQWEYINDIMDSPQASDIWLFFFNCILITTFLTAMVTIMLLRLFYPGFIKNKQYCVSSHIP
jgi:transmembrane 9 superfamily protein 2/4